MRTIRLRTIRHRAPWIAGAMIILWPIAGCTQHDRAVSADGAASGGAMSSTSDAPVTRDMPVTGDTPTTSNAPLISNTSAASSAPGLDTSAQPGRLDADRGEDLVEKALRADPTLGAFHLDADDEKGRIVIEGVVETAAQKVQAGAIASRVAPGIPIDNQLRVDAGAARRRAAAVAADEADDRVEDAFKADPTLRAFDLDADDKDGRLLLKGTVRTAAQRRAAEELARRLAPGIPLDNRIRVQSPSS